MSAQPNPKTFPTEGPVSMQFTAYDPNTFEPCFDPECNCRSSKYNIRGFGATEQEALADFWEQWNDRVSEKERQLERMEISYHDRRANT